MISGMVRSADHSSHILLHLINECRYVGDARAESHASFLWLRDGLAAAKLAAERERERERETVCVCVCVCVLSSLTLGPMPFPGTRHGL